MRQFIQGSRSAFAELERRALGDCVVFPQEEMPPGALPALARVGFEINPADDSARLFVDRGVICPGANAQVQEWLAAGEKHFTSFEALRVWIQEHLAPAYGMNIPQLPTPISPARAGVPATLAQPAPRPEDLTDLDTVRARLGRVTRPALLDEEALMRELVLRVRGQDQAIRALARRVIRHLARRDPPRPATLFAVGPTGVGKTRTGEALADAMRVLLPAGESYSSLRLDMSEYQERHRISQLLGAPQGYVGYGEGAQLIDTLAANPRTIVLFDEIEKAHPDVLRALMNAMDAGRLSTATATGQGRQIDCRWAIFYFTSNVDATGILKELEDRDAMADQSRVDQVCRNHLKAKGVAPELVGRIGRFLVFCPLNESTRAEIIALVISQLGVEYGVRIRQIDPAVIVSILEQSKSDQFGIRPYEYLIDDLLGALLARSARAYPTVPLRVSGPPFSCNPVGR